MSNIIRKSIKRAKKDRSEVYIELLKDAGPIPKGTYKVSEHDDNGFVCKLGNKVIFGVRDIPKEYCTTLKKHEIGKLTTIEEFAVNYWSNLSALKNRPFRYQLKSEPKTFCMIDPSLHYCNEDFH